MPYQIDDLSVVEKIHIIVMLVTCRRFDLLGIYAQSRCDFFGSVIWTLMHVHCERAEAW